jgi:hypothetical protein
VVFHNNVNSKTLKSIEEIAITVAIVHNLVKTGRGKVIPTDSTRSIKVLLYLREMRPFRVIPAAALWSQDPCPYAS